MKDLLGIPKDVLHSMQIVDWGYTEEDNPQTFKHFSKWVDDGLHGSLGYLADHRKDLREKISEYYPEFQSALVFLFDYTPAAKKNKIEDNHAFAAYTKGFDGMDYHFWIKEKLERIKDLLELDSFAYSIDAQPVLERDLAFRAGLGWFGKNSMLINKGHGSFFLISSIFLNKKLPVENKALETDHCGTCTRCIDACPTSAITDHRTIEANKCISTFTIERFKDDADPPEGFPSGRGEIFGCDICQDVCPWNSKPLNRSEIGTECDFENKFEKIDLENISNREFKRIFKHTSLERTGRVGLLKNLKYIK
jgi:epoxyqueuosine reductase